MPVLPVEPPPTTTALHWAKAPNHTQKNLQTINRNSRNPSLIWLAPQVVTSCRRTGYQGPQQRSRDFHFKVETMGNHSGPKTRRSFLSLLFFFFYLALPGGKSQLHSSKQWGLLSPRLRTEMGAIRNSPCLSSHDSMRALCVSLRGCSFLVYSCHTPEGMTRLRWWLEACFYSSNETTNSAELRIRLTRNAEWSFSEARMVNHIELLPSFAFTTIN